MPPSGSKAPLPKARPLADAPPQLLAPYRALRERGRDDRFVVEGELAVGRLLVSSLGWQVESLVGTQARLDRLERSPGLVAPHETQAQRFVASHQEMRELCGFDFHRGVMAVARRRSTWGCDATGVAELSTRARVRVVIAHRLADPANLGAIVRNARAFGADLLCLDAQGADPFVGKAIRASAGLLFDLPTSIYADLDELRELVVQRLTCQIWAASLGPDSIALRSAIAEKPARLALAIGNEGEGLAPDFLDICQLQVHIAMHAQVDSINAAAASAVLLYALG